MTRPIITGTNIETGEMITREMSDDEHAQYLADVEASKEIYPNEK